LNNAFGAAPVHPAYVLTRDLAVIIVIIKKYKKNQAGMNLTPPPPSQNCHVVRWHCTAESELSR